MRTLYTKYNKQWIASLPVTHFGGRIIVIQTVGEAQRAVDYLLTFPRLGIDTETRPNFKPGAMHPVALLQVSTYDTCFLFRLNYIGMPECIVRLLTSPAVMKVGLSLHDDWAQLQKRANFTPKAYVDLQDYVEPLGVEDRSLQKLFANFFSQKISKAQRLTNWEAETLSPAQKMYAAIDAWACILLYDEISHLRATGQYQLVAEPVAKAEGGATPSSRA